MYVATGVSLVNMRLFSSSTLDFTLQFHISQMLLLNITNTR